MIVGGGPSLEKYTEKIRQLRADGVKLITINGAYKWCIDKDLKPSAMVMVDARPFNARFCKPVIDDCKYFIASQCHPSVIEGLPKDRTYIWHTGAELVSDILNKQSEQWWHIPGGLAFTRLSFWAVTGPTDSDTTSPTLNSGNGLVTTLVTS